jgi:hypothetical protein
MNPRCSSFELGHKYLAIGALSSLGVTGKHEFDVRNARTPCQDKDFELFIAFCGQNRGGGNRTRVRSQAVAVTRFTQFPWKCPSRFEFALLPSASKRNSITSETLCLRLQKRPWLHWRSHLQLQRSSRPRHPKLILAWTDRPRRPVELTGGVTVSAERHKGRIVVRVESPGDDG